MLVDDGGMECAIAPDGRYNVRYYSIRFKVDAAGSPIVARAAHNGDAVRDAAY